MLLLGLISIIQITILPGLIAVNLSKIKTETAIQKWLYIFSFSLFVNYCLVMVLTLLAIYTLLTIWILLIFEILIIILFNRQKFYRLFLNFNFRTLYLKYYELIKNNSPSNRIIIAVSSLIILFYCAVFFANLGTIFYYVDTVNNYEWNRWAIDFANNILPKYSSHFPQLIPANWSICYVIINKMDVHFFPKAIMPFFFISNLLIFLDLAITKKSNVYLVGLIIYGLFAPMIYSLVFIADGNADLPVSFFAFLTFYSIIKISHKKSTSSNEENSLISLDIKSLKDYMLIFLFASIAVVTKLAGFYTFTVAVFVLGIFLLIKKNLSKKSIFKLLIFGIIVSFFSLFWHLRTPDVMVSGLNQPEYLSPGGYLTIFTKAIKLMYYNFGLPVFAFFIITIAASLFHKKVRFVSLIMVIIPTILWMFKYSADFRNLSFVVPFLSFSAAVGLFKIIGFKGSSTLQANKNELEFRTLKTKEKLLIVSTVVGSCIMFLLFTSNRFYLFLSSIYEFINKYYFQSNRIVYFIEYGLLLHVDFYQRVFIALAILIIILSVLILTKPRLNLVIIILAISAVFLNFTIFNENNILKHQTESFEKVDARNYYAWIEMTNGNKLNNEISTNFKPILHDKVPRDIYFNYIKEVSKPSLQKIKRKNYYIFLRTDEIDTQTKNFISSNLLSNRYKLLLDDKSYIFFIINPLLN